MQLLATPGMHGYRTCRVVIGTEARFIPEDERVYPELTHEWKAYVRAPAEVVRSVQFKLHESFANQFVNTEYPFEMQERGWGEFTIQLKIVLANDEKIVTSHFLKLHGEGDVVVNERIDEIVFRGTENESETCGEEIEEYKRIDSAISKLLAMFKEEADFV
jgi:YEATS domain-containing protein 4